VEPLQNSDDPITTSISILKDKKLDKDSLECGCPVNNLAQEMSPIDEEFRKRIKEIYQLWTDGLIQALHRGQKVGAVRKDIIPKKAAIFVVAACEGTIGLAKNSREMETLKSCREGLIQFLEMLRPNYKERNKNGH